MLASAAVVLGAIGLSLLAADAVEPATCSFTNARDTALSYVNDTEYYRGTSVRFTNCMLQTTGGATQGLDGVTIELKWGTTATNHTFSPTVQSAAAGTWYLTMSVPTNWEAPNIQIKVTDSGTNSFIYPWRLVHTKASM
jgi:hypothetical protein